MYFCIIIHLTMMQKFHKENGTFGSISINRFPFFSVGAKSIAYPWREKVM